MTIRLFLLSLLVLGLSICVSAADRSGEGQREAPEIGAAAGKAINAAIELLNAKDPGGARAAIGKLKFENLSPYERSRVEQILASIDNDAGKFADAAGHLAAALKAGGLQSEEVMQVRFQIAQLHLAQERWKEGAAALEAWFQVAQAPNATAYYTLAMAYYQQGDYARALPPAEKAVQLSNEPQSNWVQLLLALYLNLEKWDQAVPFINLQVRANPDDKNGWQQLASIYGQQKQYGRALVVTELMEHGGLLSSGEEYLRLADQMLHAKIPYRAAVFLTRAVEQKRVEGETSVYQKIGDAWLAAREYDRAIAPMQKAMKLSGDANLAARIAAIHLQRNDWPAAEIAAQRALAKGALTNRASTQLDLGVALFNQNKLKEARGAFEQAAQNANTRKYARSYLQTIDVRLNTQ